jgi:hypothetical protein
MPNSKNLKLLFLVILILVGAIAFSYISKSKNNLPQSNVQPTPEIPLTLLSSFPPPGKNEMPINSTAIGFLFNFSIEKSSIKVEITPKTKFEVLQDVGGTTVYIKPNTEWKYNTKYDITLSAKSIWGHELKTPIKYSFEPTPPTPSNLDEIPK